MKPDPTSLSPIMTVKQLAEYLRVNRSTLYRMVRRGQIPFFKIGADYRFSRDEIEKWMEKRQQDD